MLPSTPAGGDLESEEIRRLGSLPVIRKVLRRLGVAETIDRLCPIRDVADYTHGQIVEVLVANRLTSPQPLYVIEEWAEAWAVPEVFGVAADKLNDDRLARALDAVAEQIEAIQGSVTFRAISEYRLSLKQLHYDATSFMFEGAYADEGDPAFPKVARGYNAQQDMKRKQVRTGLAAAADGGVPIFHKTFDGNRTDSNSLVQLHQATWAQLQAQGATPEEAVVVGDSKLLAKGNVARFLGVEGLYFVGPLERGAELERELLTLDAQGWQELPYASEAELLRRKKEPPEEWNRFWAQEKSWKVTDASGKVHELRKIFIRSAEEQRAARRSRERQMASAEADLQKVANGIPRYYKTEEHVRRKVHDILRDRRVTGFFRVEVGSRDGRPYLSWAPDAEAIVREERLRGHYVLLTNLPNDKTPNDVLSIHKGQYRVEQRFSHWKGPLRVRPIFIHDNRRIAALILVTALALMIFCLIEREVRRELGDEQGYAVGFLPGKRRSRPTGAKILQVMENRIWALVDPGRSRLLKVYNLRGTAARVYEVFQVTPGDLKGG